MAAGPPNPLAGVPAMIGSTTFHFFNNLVRLHHGARTLDLADVGLLAELAYTLTFDKSQTAGLSCGIVDLALPDSDHADKLVSCRIHLYLHFKYNCSGHSLREICR